MIQEDKNVKITYIRKCSLTPDNIKYSIYMKLQLLFVQWVSRHGWGGNNNFK